jgi:hypothetical protein
MNGPDKDRMIVLEADDGGHVMCSGCRAMGEGFNYRPPSECPTPWLNRQQLVEALQKAIMLLNLAEDALCTCGCADDLRSKLVSFLVDLPYTTR